MRLAAARAKLRVEYVLSLRRVELPTKKCRPVLTAISSGDRRRQRALAAGDHLTTCETCAELSKPLLERRRGLAGLWPLPLAKVLFDRFGRQIRQYPAQTATAVALVTAVTTGAVVITQDDAEVGRPGPVTATQPADGPVSTASPSPINPGPVSVDGQPLLPVPPPDLLAGLAGRPVAVGSAAVESVPADEGFWIGETPEQRLWVQLLGATESPFTVRPGMRVSFQGVLVANAPGFAQNAALDPPEGAAQLEQQGHHIEVDASAITLG